MKFTHFPFFLILFLTFLIVLSGCTSEKKTPFQDEKPTEDISAKITLGQAYLGISEGNSRTTGQLPHIYYIKGVQISADALAKEWIFGVKKGNLSYFITYNKNGETVTPWGGNFTSDEIFIDEKFLYPEDLFTAHRMLIQDITENGKESIDELEFIDGEYYLTMISNSTTNVWIYDGSNGAEIASL